MKSVVFGVFFVAVVALSASPSLAGCSINLTVRNAGYTDGRISVSTTTSKVKSKGGTWRTLWDGQWRPNGWRFMDDGDFAADVFKATFGCNRKRRYRIKYSCSPHNGDIYTREIYYPSTNGWTTRQDVTIGLTCPN